MGTIKKLAGQTAIYGLSTMVGRLLNYLLFPLHTRLFAPAEYAVVTEIYAWATFLLVIYTYGMETAFFRFASQEEGPDKGKAYSTAFLTMLMSSLVLSGLLWAFAGPISASQGFGSHPEYIFFLAGIMGLDAIAALPFAKLRQEGKSLRYALIRLLGIGVNIGATLIFYLVAHYEGVGYVFLANLLGSAAMLLALLPGAMPRFMIEVERLKTMLAYGLPLLIAGLAGMINESLTRLALDDFLPGTETAKKTALGIFGSNYKLAVLMTLFTQTFRMAAEPFFFEQAKNKDAPSTYAKVHTVFTLLGLGIVLGVGLFLDVFKRLADSRYHDDFEVVPILLMANLLLGMYYNLTVWYKLTGNTKFGAQLSVFGAVITFGGTALLVPWIGVGGAAISTLLCYLVMAILCYTTGQRNYPIPYQVGPLGWAIGLGALLLIPPYILPALGFGLGTEGQRLIYGVVALGVFAVGMLPILPRLKKTILS